MEEGRGSDEAFSLTFIKGMSELLYVLDIAIDAVQTHLVQPLLLNVLHNLLDDEWDCEAVPRQELVEWDTKDMVGGDGGSH